MRKHLVNKGVVGLLALSLISCSKSNDTSSTSARSYQAAGSRWAISFTDSTFNLQLFEGISDTTADMTVDGTVAQNSTNLFKILTVSSASGTDAPTSGTQAFALEMEGTGTFIQPFGDPNPIVATVVSTCPSANFTANWVITKPSLDGGVWQTTTVDDDGAGIATFNQAADSFLVRSAGIVDGELQAEVDGSEFNPFGMSSSCSAGKLPVNADFGSGPEIFDMYFTPSGQIVVKFPDAMGGQIISGFPQTSAAVSASTVDGTYSVFLYTGGTSADLANAEVVPAKLTLSSGSGSITEITAIDTNTEDTTPVFTVGSFSNQDDSGDPMPNGQFRLALTNLGNGEVTCVTTDGTPRVIACYGYYLGGTGGTRRPVSILGRIR